MERQSVDKSGGRRASKQSSDGSASLYAGMQRNKAYQRSFSPYGAGRKGLRSRHEASAGDRSQSRSDVRLSKEVDGKIVVLDNGSNEEPTNTDAAELLASSMQDSAEQTSNDCESSLIASSVSSYKLSASPPPAAPGGVSTPGEGRPQPGDVYQKLTSKGQATYLQIEAVWVLDQSKRVNVEVTLDDQVSFLQSKIGERMEETYDDFRGLRHVVASQVYGSDNGKATQPEGQSKKSPSAPARAPHQAAIEQLRSAYGKGVSLDPNLPVRDCLKDGETVYF